MRPRLRRLLKPALETVGELGEAIARVAQEYRDVEKMRAAGGVWFDAVVYMAPMVKSDGERFFAALQALDSVKVLPRGHDVEVVLAVPRWTGALYVRAFATSAEGAAQVLLMLARRALDDAGLTLERVQIEIDLAADGSKVSDILGMARPTLARTCWCGHAAAEHDDGEVGDCEHGGCGCRAFAHEASA
jgi:hypothetical protein